MRLREAVGNAAASRLGWEEPARRMEALYGELVEAESPVA
jgi:hypothetical protein